MVCLWAELDLAMALWTLLAIVRLFEGALKFVAARSIVAAAFEPGSTLFGQGWLLVQACVLAGLAEALGPGLLPVPAFLALLLEACQRFGP